MKKLIDFGKFLIAIFAILAVCSSAFRIFLLFFSEETSRFLCQMLGIYLVFMLGVFTLICTEPPEIFYDLEKFKQQSRKRGGGK